MTSSEVVGTIRIRTPLLAFEHVLRGTGTQRKTCVFENPGQETLLAVRFAFREHSWLQIEPESRGEPHEPLPPERLRLAPGETRVALLIHTDSSNFPRDRFRGRVHFDDVETGQCVGWIELNFERIEEFTDFDGFAAIDLGTSHSTLALYHLGRDVLRGEPWNPELEPHASEVPSAVFVRDLSLLHRHADAACAVGRRALHEYGAEAAHDPRALLVGCKRFVGGPRLLAADARGTGGTVDPLDVLYVLGRFVRERSQAHDGVRARLRRLIVTFPPTWNHRQIEAWKGVFHRLGFSDDDLDLSLDEASAAGLFHVFRWTHDADARTRLLQDLMASQHDVREDGRRGEGYTLRMVSFDFGGGTTDMALIRVDLTAFDDVLRMRVALEGSDSVDFGGDDVTLAVLRILKRRIALALACPERAAGESPARVTAPARPNGSEGRFVLPSDRRRHLGGFRRRSDAAEILEQRWDEVEARIADPRLDPVLEEAIDELFPTRFSGSADEPIRLDSKRNFVWLWDRAESLKCALFREASARERDLPLGAANEHVRGGVPLADLPEHAGAPRTAPGGEPLYARLTVEEVYRAVSEPIGRAVARAAALAGQERVDRVVLTGQSSWIPLVRRLFMRPRGEGGLGLAPNKIEFDAENAKAAVSKGACLLQVMREALVGFDVDVSSFRANLLGEVFYRGPLGERRRLFAPGPIDEIAHAEADPDPRGFARRLTLFHNSESTVLGQFRFDAAGEALPDVDERVARTARDLGVEALPKPDALQRDGAERSARHAAVRHALAAWPELDVVAWIERHAAPGRRERPRYRFYLTRNRNVVAVRDAGEAGKRLFRLVVAQGPALRVAPEKHPFSGVH